MEILIRSPMLGILVSLASGLAFYDKFGIAALIIAVPLIFSGIMFCSYNAEFPDQWKVFCVGIILAILSSLEISYLITRPDIENLTFKNENGLITLVRTWGKSYATIIETEHYGKFVMLTRFAEISEGTRIKFDGSTRKFRTNSKNSNFNESRYWKARGVQAWVKAENITELDEKFSFAGLRHKISRYLTIYTPKLIGEYLRAAWLGEHTQELDEKHRRWGTSHLLAVSGFHVGIVMLCAVFLFGNDVFIMSFILWLYIILTGATPSVMRAGLMFQIGIFAKILGRRVNGVNSVSSAAVILLMFRPFLFWDIGFRLSVLTALTITAARKINKNTMPFISTIIFLVTYPQISYTFKGVPLVGILLNIFAPLYFSFAFVIASVSVFAKFLQYPAEGIFFYWEILVKYARDLNPQVVGWKFFAVWTCTGIFIFMFCMYFHFSHIRTIILTIILSLAAFLIFL